MFFCFGNLGTYRPLEWLIGLIFCDVTEFVYVPKLEANFQYYSTKSSFVVSNHLTSIYPLLLNRSTLNDLEVPQHLLFLNVGTYQHLTILNAITFDKFCKLCKAPNWLTCFFMMLRLPFWDKVQFLSDWLSVSVGIIEFIAIWKRDKTSLYMIWYS